MSEGDYLFGEAAELLAVRSSSGDPSTSGRASSQDTDALRDLREYESLNKQLLETRESYVESLRGLAAKVKVHKRPTSSFEEEVEGLGQPVRDLAGDVAGDFFLCQMRNNPSDSSLLIRPEVKRQAPVNYTKNDLVFAFSVYCNSPTCYGYLSKVGISILSTIFLCPSFTFHF
jgi:hypothetical protein